MFESAVQLNLKLFLGRVFKRETLSLLLVVSGLLTSWYGYSHLQSLSAETALLEQTELSDPADDASLDSVILVEAAGMVVNPGVYQVASTARVGDVLEKAGGLKKEADQDFVAKDLNLAQSISDGQKIYIPFAGELEEESQLSLSGDNQPINPSNSTGAKISINSASTTELQTLKGIGEARAESIIANRPYATVQDLLENGVLGQATYENIFEQLTL